MQDHLYCITSAMTYIPPSLHHRCHGLNSLALVGYGGQSSLWSVESLTKSAKLTVDSIGYNEIAVVRGVWRAQPAKSGPKQWPPPFVNGSPQHCCVVSENPQLFTLQQIRNIPRPSPPPPLPPPPMSISMVWDPQPVKPGYTVRTRAGWGVGGQSFTGRKQ